MRVPPGYRIFHHNIQPEQRITICYIIKPFLKNYLDIRANYIEIHSSFLLKALMFNNRVHLIFKLFQIILQVSRVEENVIYKTSPDKVSN